MTQTLGVAGAACLPLRTVGERTLRYPEVAVLNRRLLLLVFLVPVLAACGDERISDEQGRIEVLRQWESSDSGIRRREFVRITNEQEWEELWGRHTGRPEKTPLVDFTKDMVLGVFAGEDYNISELKLISLTEEDDLIRLRFAKGGLSDDIFYGNLRRLSLAALYRIPHTGKKIIFEEEQRDRHNKVTCTEVAELPSL